MRITRERKKKEKLKKSECSNYRKIRKTYPGKEKEKEKKKSDGKRGRKESIR